MTASLTRYFAPTWRFFPILLLAQFACLAAPVGAPRVHTLPQLQVSDPLPIPQGYLERQAEDYYGIYDKTPNSKKNGAKIGWMKASQRPTVWNGERWAGEPVVQFDNISTFIFRLEGKRVENVTTESFVFARKAPYVLLKAGYTEELKGFTRRITLRRAQSGSYDAEIMEGNTTRNRTLDGLTLTLQDLASPETWAVDRSRRTGDCFSSQSFDIKELTPYVDKYKFLASKTEAINGAEIPVWVVECEDTKANYKTIFRYTAAGKMLSAFVAGTTELRRESREMATRIDVARDIFADSLVPVTSEKLPGPDNRAVQRMKLTIHGPDVSGIPNSINQTVTYPSGNQKAVIVVGPNSGKAQKATPEEIKSNLDETSDLPISDPGVQKLAANAVGTAKLPRQKVLNILKFVQRYVEDDYGAEPLSLFDIMKQRKGDCTEHAMLFTALCRASGVPCREATGYLYMGDAKKAFGGHAWNEVVLDGDWIPVDPTWGEFPLDATHIQLSSGKSTMRDAKFLSGGVEISIESVVLRPPAGR